MPDKSPETYFLIITGVILALMLVGFIVTILFLYQRRRHQQEQELVRMKDKYDQEALKSQLEIQENTFQSISQELHDNIGQMLSVVKISLAVLPMEKSHEAWEPVQSSRQILNKAITDLSNLTKSLHTDRITEISLADSIRFEIESVKKLAIMNVDYEVNGEEFAFDDQKKIFLFRMFQEVFNNMLKHSQAKQVKVALNYSQDNTFVMIIKDDGIGFNVEEKLQSANSSSGVGLKSLFNRARLVGAALTMDSVPGTGTTTTITIERKEN